MDNQLPTIEAQAEAPPLDRFHEVELGKLFDAILSINSVRMQQFALFSTLNVAIVSVALTSQRAGLLVFGGMVWLLGIAGDQIQREIAVRYFYRAYLLQRRFAPAEPFTYLTAHFLDTLAPHMTAIDPTLPPAEQVRLLRRIARRHALVPGSVLVLAMSALEIALGLYLALGAGWNTF